MLETLKTMGNQKEEKSNERISTASNRKPTGKLLNIKEMYYLS